MSTLMICPDDNPENIETIKGHQAIVDCLAKQGVQFEYWLTHKQLSHDAGQAEVMAAYQSSIDELNNKYDFNSVDVVSLQADHPDKVALRQKFFAEHTHDDFEVRFFVDGCGLFYLRLDNKVYMLLCEKGNLISVPANTPHWFDMGENPFFKCVRFFTTPNGWEGNFTDSDIVTRFPSFDDVVAEKI